MNAEKRMFHTALPDLFTRTADSEFAAFHEANPKVYAELVRLARDLKARGHRKLGIKMLYEVVRWKRMLQTTDDTFKLNNNHHSRYARLIMRQEPDLRDVFELRGLKS